MIRHPIEDADNAWRPNTDTNTYIIFEIGSS